MPTLVILGAGDLGGTVARQSAVRGVARTIVLVDDAAGPAKGKALDQAQAAAIDGYAARITGTGDDAALIGAACVVVADRFGPPSTEWGDEAGLALVRRAAALAPEALIICAGAHQLTLVDQGVRELGIDRRRLIGSAPEALRAAVTAMTALEAGCAPAEVSLTVLGRPPSGWVVPWDEAGIAGRAAPHVLSAAALKRLDDRVARLWPPWPRTLGGAAARLVAAALSGVPGRPSAFVVPDRLPESVREEAAPQLADRAVALPVVLGPLGLVRLEVPALSTRDRVRLETALHS